MNTQHLQYLIEIERTRSVSQAAENLFIGQPNLSRILHEMEANLGFKIFERTSKGVRSTERGAIFLQHAKSIILERIDALGPRHPVENRLRICIPRAAFILDLTADYLNTLPADQNLDSVVRECHARQAIEMLENGEVEVDLVEVMSCRTGCVGGAGQPYALMSTKLKRAHGLYEIDRSAMFKRSERNPVLDAMYAAGLNERAHELLHHEYKN